MRILVVGDPDCVHDSFVDAFNVGTCKKCGQVKDYREDEPKGTVSESNSKRVLERRGRPRGPRGGTLQNPAFNRPRR